MDNARFISSLNSSSSYANPPPVPPRVNAGRRTTGKPISFAISSPCSSLFAMSDWITGSPRSSQSSLKSSLSSARSMLLLLVPRSSTRHSLSTPFFSSCIARLRPVCPPMPGRIASGLSYLIILARYSRVSGSMYTLSAIDVSVMMVAGLELQSTTSYPSSLSAIHACVPA